MKQHSESFSFRARDNLRVEVSHMAGRLLAGLDDPLKHTAMQALGINGTPKHLSNYLNTWSRCDDKGTPYFKEPYYKSTFARLVHFTNFSQVTGAYLRMSLAPEGAPATDVDTIRQRAISNRAGIYARVKETVVESLGGLAIPVAAEKNPEAIADMQYAMNLKYPHIVLRMLLRLEEDAARTAHQAEVGSGNCGELYLGLPVMSQGPNPELGSLNRFIVCAQTLSRDLVFDFVPLDGSTIANR